MRQSGKLSLARRLHDMTRGDGLRAQLIRGGMGTAGIQVLGRVLALATGIILARILGAEGYGVYAYAFAIMSLLSVAAEAGVPPLLMREVGASYGREEWGVLRGAMIRSGQIVLVVSTLVSVMGLTTLWAMADRLSAAMFYTNGLMLLVLPLSALGKTVANAIYGLHRVVVGQAMLMVLRPSLVLLAVAGVFFAFPAWREPYIAMAAQLSAVLIVLFVGVRVLMHVLPRQIPTIAAQYRDRAWLKSAAPFLLIGGAGIINNQTDIIMLGWFRDASDVGIYRVAVQGATLVALGLQVVNVVAAPHFARLYAQGDMVRLQRLATTAARGILLTALPLAFAFICFGGAIAGWVFGTEFTNSHLPLAILAIGQLFNAGFGSVGFLLDMSGHEKETARALWLTAVLNILLNAIFIPFYGMAGAAGATAISLAVQNGLLFRSVHRLLNLNTTAFYLGISK